MVVPVVALVIEELTTPTSIITHADVGPVVAALEKTTPTTERNPLPHPKKAPVIILE